MTRTMLQSPTQAASRHLLLFDGYCGLCTAFVQFVLPRDPGGIFHFASLSSPEGRSMVGRHGGDPDDVSTVYVVADYQSPEPRALTRSRAALFVLGALGWPWKAATLFGVLPTGLLDHAYDFVARNRYRVFGRREHCLMPRPEWRDRFIDLGTPISDFTGDGPCASSFLAAPDRSDPSLPVIFIARDTTSSC
jgi:predicted DCC family thiol-disulfide oxidoreductase YuxK